MENQPDQQDHLNWWEIIDLDEKPSQALAAASYGSPLHAAGRVGVHHLSQFSRQPSVRAAKYSSMSRDHADYALTPKSEYSDYNTATGFTEYTGYTSFTGGTNETKSKSSGRKMGNKKQHGTETSKLLSMIEQSVCSSLEYVESGTVRNIERLRGLETQIKKSDTWQFWQEMAETGTLPKYESALLCRNADISQPDENRDGDNPVDRRRASGTRYTYPNFHGTNPLGPRNSKDPKRAGKDKWDEKHETVDFLRTDRVRNVHRPMSFSASAETRDSSKTPEAPIMEVKVRPSSQEELPFYHDTMSILTDDYNPFLLHDFHEPRPCVRLPRLDTLTKRFDLMKRVKSAISMNKSIASAETLPVLRMITDSKSTNNTDGGDPAYPVYYVYDYESSDFAYVAYFERNKSPTSSIQLFQHPKPESFKMSKGEALVQITTSSVSPTDSFVRRGLWRGDSAPNSLKLPIIPGVSFVGKVQENHDPRSGLKKGDRVCSLVRHGANSRHMAIDTECLVKVPSDIKDYDAIACLPEVHLAAFQALHIGQKNGSRYRRNALVNKKILVLGGTGTMGRALLELARAAGAEAVYATGRDKEFDLITSIGGLPMSKDPRHWLSLIAGKVDIVIAMEAPYAKPELKYDHIQTLAFNGQLVLIGAPDQGDRSNIDIDSIDGTRSSTKRKLHSYNVFDSWENDLKLAKRDLTHLMKLCKEGTVRPHILDSIPLNKVGRAHKFFETKKVTGFILCEPWITGTRKGNGAQSPIHVHKRLAREVHEEEFGEGMAEDQHSLGENRGKHLPAIRTMPNQHRGFPSIVATPSAPTRHVTETMGSGGKKDLTSRSSGSTRRLV